ncbi:4'-phosphopantetheinyl transferase family protein [Paraburkholderia sediminicola]|uniref:4'-phosphopantetheinyl transferase family protein n=1 Tax=Paraburkholderia sediminicola TaxID=458836 RepID=UPI0038BCFE1E
MPIQLMQTSPARAYGTPGDGSCDTMFDPCEITFAAHRMTRRYPSWIDVPRPGELHLWRFRCGWLPVSIHEGERWLSETERERARLNPNSALRKRFVAARVVLRWIIANLLDSAPHEVKFVNGPAEQPGVHIQPGGCPVTIDIAYGGIWIVIGIASTALGLGIEMPRPGSENIVPVEARASIWPTGAPDRRPDRFRYADESLQSARYSSLSNALKRPSIDVELQALRDNAVASFVDLLAAGRWHVVDVPMPGKIRAAVSVAHPITTIQAFGWTKS